MEPLIEALRISAPVGVQLCAAEALGDVDDTRAIEPLTDVSKSDEDEVMRWRASEALEKIRQRQAGRAP